MSLPATIIEIKQEGAGVVLAEDADFTAWTDGDDLTVENVADAYDYGGDLKINAGEVNETIVSYSGVDRTTQRLKGVVVISGAAQHGAGTVGVLGSEAGAEASTADYLEKLATVMVGGDPTQVLPDVPVSPVADTYLRLGARSSVLAETVGLVVDSDDSDPYIGIPPMGAKPVVASDPATLNPDAVIPIAGQVVEDNVTPIGLGDGAAPTNPVAAPTVIRSPKLNIVDMRAYSIPADWVAFEVERATSSGGPWTSLGESGALFVDNNISYGTTYYYRYKVKDSEGNVTAVSPASSGDQPAQAGTADLQVGSVTATILASVITLSTLFRTAASGARVEFDGSGIRLYNSGGTTTANLDPSSGIATLYGAVFRSSLTASGSRVEIDSNGMRFYDSSGVLIMNLSTASGNISLKGSITSGSDITGATVSGGTVTGATVRTSGLGTQRLELNTDYTHGSLIWKNASNLPVAAFSYDPTNGWVSLIGADLDVQQDLVVTGMLTVGSYEGAFDHNGSTFGVLGKAPVTKRTDPSDIGNTSGTAVDGNCRTKVNDILAVLRAYGFI